MDDRVNARELDDELQNFEAVLKSIQATPDKIPRLAGIEIDGVQMPLRGTIGGDHVLYVDFNKRYDLEARIRDAEDLGQNGVAEKLELNKHRAGVLVADVSGHRATDAVIAAMLHQSFLLGTYYELDRYGEITTRLFEHINTRFFKSTCINKYFTMIYGEISNRGRFRFITAAHPPPLVFSREYGRFMSVSPKQIVSFPPVGILPSDDDSEQRYPSLVGYKKRYTVNEINLLVPGDLLLLHTDGLSEHADGNFLVDEVEPCLAETRDESALTICSVLAERIRHRGEPSDDISFVVIKRTNEA